MRVLGVLALGGWLLAAQSFLAAQEPKPITIVWFGAPIKSVVDDLNKELRVTVLTAGLVPGKKENNVAGLEQLDKADLWIGSSVKRTLPDAEQLAQFQKFVAQGKPIVGYRQASHCFNNWLVDGKLIPEVRIDQVVFGAKYGLHWHTNNETKCQMVVPEKSKGHSIIKGIEPPPMTSVDNGLYKYTELADDVTVLISGGLPGDMMPHTWVRENPKTKARAFYTRYDGAYIAGNAAARQIFTRGILWSLERDPK